MRAGRFFAVAAAGTLVTITIVYFLGDILRAPLRDVADFVSTYQWYLTPLTFSLVAVQLLRRRRRHRLPIESVEEFEHELEEPATP